MATALRSQLIGRSPSCTARDTLSSARNGPRQARVPARRGRDRQDTGVRGAQGQPGAAPNAVHRRSGRPGRCRHDVLHGRRLAARCAQIGAEPLGSRSDRREDTLAAIVPELLGRSRRPDRCPTSDAVRDLPRGGRGSSGRSERRCGSWRTSSGRTRRPGIWLCTRLERVGAMALAILVVAFSGRGICRMAIPWLVRFPTLRPRARHGVRVLGLDRLDEAGDAVALIQALRSPPTGGGY